MRTTWNYDDEGELMANAITGDGKYIVTGGWKEILRYFNKYSNTPIWSTVDFGTRVEEVAISNDGEYIACGTRDNGTTYNSKIMLFTKSSSTPVWIFDSTRTDNGNNSEVASLHFSNDGEYLVASNYTKTMWVFHKSSNVPLWKYDFLDPEGGNTLWNAMVNTGITPDGKYVYGALGNSNRRGQMILFEVESGNKVWTWLGDAVGDDWEYPFRHGCRMSKDGTHIALSLYRSGKVKVFHYLNPVPIFTLETGELNYTDLSNDGQTLATSYDDTLVLSDVGNTTPLWTKTGVDDAGPIAVSGNGEFVFAQSNSPARYRMYNRAGTLLEGPTDLDSESSNSSQTLSVSKDWNKITVVTDTRPANTPTGSGNLIFMFDYRPGFTSSNFSSLSGASDDLSTESNNYTLQNKEIGTMMKIGNTWGYSVVR